MNVLLFGVVFAFVVCHSPRVVEELTQTYMTLSGRTGLDLFLARIYELSRWALLLGSSCNMAIYAWVDRGFRRALAKLLVPGAKA